MLLSKVSTVTQELFIGSLYIHKMARLHTQATKKQMLHPDTTRILAREQERLERHAPDAGAVARRLWRVAASRALHQSRAGAHYGDHISVSSREHMSDVDCFDGARIRGQSANDKKKEHTTSDEDLLSISPEVDGRLKDEGRSQ
jgi:5'-nucleotidase